MVILLQINKINFEKKDSPEKNHTSQNQGKILKEKCCFFKKKNLSMIFLKLPKNSVWKSWEKSREIAWPNLDYISSKDNKSNMKYLKGKKCSF